MHRGSSCQWLQAHAKLSNGGLAQHAFAGRQLLPHKKNRYALAITDDGNPALDTSSTLKESCPGGDSRRC
eukprot:20991-Amphidinium_carterae.1